MTTEMPSLIRVLLSAPVLIGVAVWIGTRIARKMEEGQERIYGALTKNCVEPEPADTTEQTEYPTRFRVILSPEDATRLVRLEPGLNDPDGIFADTPQLGYASVRGPYLKEDGTTYLSVSTNGPHTTIDVFGMLWTHCIDNYQIEKEI